MYIYTYAHLYVYELMSTMTLITSTNHCSSSGQREKRLDTKFPGDWCLTNEQHVALPQTSRSKLPGTNFLSTNFNVATTERAKQGFPNPTSGPEAWSPVGRAGGRATTAPTQHAWLPCRLC